MPPKSKRQSSQRNANPGTSPKSQQSQRHTALNILKPRRALPERSPAKAQCQDDRNQPGWMFNRP